MGLDFIRSQRETFVQRRDYTHLGPDIPDLLARLGPDRVWELFSAMLHRPDATIIEGLRLLIKFESEALALIVQNGVVIGELLQSDALKLSARMKEAGKTSGMLTVLTSSSPDFRGIFQVRLSDGKDLRKP